MTVQAPTGPEFDIVGTEAIRDPHGYFGRMREIAPVLWDTRSRSWIVTGYQEVTAALRDDKHFSSDRIRPFIAKKLSGPDTDPKVRQAFEVLANWLVFNDKPKHLRLRMLINQAFMSKAMTRLTEKFEALFNDVITAAPAAGRIDIVADVSVPFSASVISEMLGVPREDRGLFAKWHRLFGPVVGASLDDANKYDSLAEGVSELSNYVRTLIERYRKDPEDNLLSELIKAQDDKDALSEDEIIATCTLVLFAGSETTANLIANAILALLRNPEQMSLIRSGGVKITDAVEEFLRFDGSGKAVTRVVREDTDALGVSMKAGQRVFLILAAANHDPSVFEDPDKLVLNRSWERKHIAFGYGLHSCMGLQLARLEAAIAIPGILGKWSHIELDGELEWHPQLLSRGLKALPVKVSA
ncbi:cytochrome P450 [Sphingobium phenoxybenzoativorans]|uniref:Cytochrome P450 n=1 Tax=Sphingobium phenoxybenzoativorans TaxID=1592790 RepID=A0A975K653_9SPHN|nr:cytochrome P450 [Sphingobium phenoxybenzoativorans]QUT05504.1 cytochrome P450 [Sphingobium phenoxybenzoativorans]